MHTDIKKIRYTYNCTSGDIGIQLVYIGDSTFVLAVDRPCDYLFDDNDGDNDSSTDDSSWTTTISPSMVGNGEYPHVVIEVSIM